jgi:hypothetical protein
VKIYIPGRGSVDSNVYKVDAAVRQYNDRLSFGLNEDTQEYCIFMRMPHPEPVLPILGFGREVPHPDAACKKLWESDTMIHGDKILNDILKSQEEYKAALRYNSDQASADSAERIEYLMRTNGDSPVIKSTRKVVKKNDNHD